MTRSSGGCLDFHSSLQDVVTETHSHIREERNFMFASISDIIFYTFPISNYTAKPLSPTNLSWWIAKTPAMLPAAESRHIK